MTLDEFLPQYFELHAEVKNKKATLIAKRQILNRTILPQFANRNLESIRKADIMLFIARCKQAGLANKTINNHLTVLRNILSVAVDLEVIPVAPRVKLLATFKPQIEYLTPSESSAFVESIKESLWREAVRLVLNTGLRIGELRALKWKDFSRDPFMLTVVRACASHGLAMGTPKGNRVRRIPLNSEAVRAYKAIHRLNEFVIALPGLAEQPVSYGRCILALHKAAAEFGLKDIGWHTLRHTFASTLAARGNALQDIKELLGHSDISTTLKYAHVAPTTLVKAVDSLV